MPKVADDLTDKDFQNHPVWKFSSKEEPDETAVVPLKKLPVQNLDGKIAGCKVKFSNGTEHMAMLGNIDTGNPDITEHFLSVSIWKSGKWFHLARYFDPDHKRKGPTALARFLGVKVSDIFPISYDIRKISNGRKGSLVGKVFKEPRKRLSSEERIELALL